MKKKNKQPEHAKLFPPSAADRWLACGASIDENADRIEGSSNASADLGTVAHRLLEWCLLGKSGVLDPKRFLKKCIHEDFPKIKVDQDMVDAVDTAVAFCQKRIGKALAWGSETRFDIPETGEFGTCDFWAIMKLKSGRFIIDIADYKNGSGHAVFSDSSKQMWVYLLGLLNYLIKQKILKTKDIARVKFCRLTIIQPRCHEKEPIDSVTIDMDAVQEFSDTVRTRVEDYNSGKLADEYTPGEKQCQWCAIKNDCKARLKWAAEGTVKKFDDFVNPKKSAFASARKFESAKRLSEKEFATWYERASILRSILGEMQKEAVKRALAGKLPGYKMVEGRSTRVWADELLVRKTFRRLKISEDLYAPRKLVGVTVGSSLIPKEKRKAVMESITRKPIGSPTIALESDRRLAYKPADAKNVFADFVEDFEE